MGRTAPYSTLYSHPLVFVKRLRIYSFILYKKTRGGMIPPRGICCCVYEPTMLIVVSPVAVNVNVAVASLHKLLDAFADFEP